MNIRLLLSFIFILILKIESYAQLYVEPSTYVQKARIGLVDEFIKRFNNQESHPNISLKGSILRRENLVYLFDASNANNNKDSVRKEVNSFIDAVLRDSTILCYSDTNWFGIAHCKGTLFGKKVVFDLYLSVQHRYDDMYKWVIAKANGKCFDVEPRDSCDNIMLSPDCHETKFMSLGRMTKEQPFNVSLFMAKGFEYEQTSVFAYLVKANQLKIDYVDNLEFVFTQVPGYLFHIKYFERESGNSGWLIHKLYKMDDDEKANLLNSLHIKHVFNGKISQKQYHTYGDSCCMRFDKELINKRVAEETQQVSDYLNYIQTLSNYDARRYYVKRLKKLFANDAKVHISETKFLSNYAIVSIEDFCKRILYQNTKVVYKVDSICIPSWNGLNKIENTNLSESKMPCSDDHLLSIKDTTNASFIVEQTEDGMEIMIYLGDLFISKKE